MKKRFNIPDQSTQAVEFINSLSGLVEVEKVNQTRTSQQNRALHLFFTILADQLNDCGEYFRYIDYNGEVIELPQSKDTVKEYIWRPLQKKALLIESTTKLTTQTINTMLDALTLHYGNKGLPIKFPNQFDAYLDKVKKEIEKL
jgi:hypothetical protein